MQMGTRCFLIDNDEDDQEIFLLALQEIDPSITVAVADNGTDAINQLTDTGQIPSFIFIDMNMPAMNGRQCLEAIREMRHLASVPVYMYSTAANPRSIEEVKKLGATDFIVKPPSFKELTRLLAAILPEKNPGNE